MMAATDRYGFEHASRSRKVLDAFAEATHALVSYRPHAGIALVRALDADPHLVAAHALRGLGQAMLARPELLDDARSACAAAHEAGAATADEAALLHSLDLVLAGRQRAAADVLETRLERNPRALLLVKLANMLCFQTGDLAGLARSAARVLPEWEIATPG